MLGQRVAVLVDGLAAHCGVGVVEGVAVLFGHLIENAEVCFTISGLEQSPQMTAMFFP